jgi:hypothetical protein
MKARIARIAVRGKLCPRQRVVIVQSSPLARQQALSAIPTIRAIICTLRTPWLACFVHPAAVTRLCVAWVSRRFLGLALARAPLWSDRLRHGPRIVRARTMQCSTRSLSLA